MISQMTRTAADLYYMLVSNSQPISTVFHNSHLTESEHLKALSFVAAFTKLVLSDSQVELVWPRIKRKCQLQLKSSINRCNDLSVSNARCQLLPHKIKGQYVEGQTMDEALKGRCYSHFSGYSYISTCNCGHTQKARADPFDAKDGNYDFYLQFHCCQKKENLPFKLYNPGIKCKCFSKC